jgi:TPR repeat protein
MNQWSKEVKKGSCALGVWFSATGNSGNLDGIPLLVRRSSGKSWNDPFYKQRIINEAETLKTLKTLNTTVVPDLISFSKNDDEAVLCVEHYDRRTVKKLVEKQKLSLEDSLFAIERLADTLRLFHRKNCIHNYICPWTVSIEEDGDPVFTDLSLAEFGKGSQHEKLPEEIPLQEILPYLPPETVKREATTSASDVYQLGGLLYYILTGKPPWPGDEYVKVVAQGISSPPPPSSINNKVNAELDSLVLQMLSLEPSKRPRTQEIVKKLQELSSFKETELPDSPVKTFQTPLSSSPSLTTIKSDHKKMIIPIFTVLILIISGGLWSFLSTDKPESIDIDNDSVDSSTKTANNGSSTSSASTKQDTGKTNNPATVPSRTPEEAIPAKPPAPVKDYSKVEDARDLPAEELFTIGVAFHKGLGGREKSPEKAVYYYGLGAEKGNASCQNNLAYCLLIGEGTKEHLEHGQAWLGQAVENGSVEAAINLSQLYYRGIVGAPSPEKAIELLKTRTKSDNAMALYHLGQAYRQAKSIARNYEQAVKAFRESAQMGFGPSFMELARHYDKGIGTKLNPEQADVCRKQAEVLEKAGNTEFNTKLVLVVPR